MSEGRLRPILKSAGALGLVAVVGTGLLAAVHRLTADRIAEQERRVVLEQLSEIVPPERYDNALQDDWFTFRDERWFPGGQTVTVYRARKQGTPVAVILRFAALRGYNGRIQLLAGINYDGSVAGVRVVGHKETPGLGDAIESDKSDWALSFNGRSLGDPPRERWAVKRDGGVFDQFTGATISPRAVVDGVRGALEYFEPNRDWLFSTPAQTSREEQHE